MTKNKEIIIAVTGGSGFLGTRLVSALKRTNFKIRLFDKSKYDLFNPDSLKDFLEDVSAVIHLVGVNRASDFEVFKGNTAATLGLLQGIEKFSPKTKIIFSSSAQVYLPTSLYGLSKKFAEELIIYYSKMKKNPSVILRFSNIYGHGCRPFYNSVIATFIDQIKKNKTININGDGSSQRDYIYVEDAVTAIIQSIDYSLDNYKIFDICSGKQTSLNEIVAFLEKLLSKKVDVAYNKLVINADWIINKDYKSAKELLNWEPTINIEEGLSEYVKNEIKH